MAVASSAPLNVVRSAGAQWACERPGVWARQNDVPTTAKCNPDLRQEPGGPNAEHFSGRRITVVNRGG
eukprot:4838318-Alexandrium_andersonii.AAC.1